MPKSRNALARHDARARAVERDYRHAALRLFGTEREQIVSLVTRAAAAGDRALAAALRLVERNYTETDGAYHRAWVESYVDLTTQLSRVAAKELLGFNFNLVNPEVVSAAVRRASTLADYVGETSANRISEAVARGLREGSTDIAQEIRDRAFDEDTTLWRAEMIARTETIGALNEGEYVSALESGVFATKTWMTQGDDRVRESHAELDGVEIPLDEVFDNGLMFPGDQDGDPEEVINCRCTLLYNDTASTPEEG
jgi:uncharacterized protein with gpF-like domain